MSLKLNIGAGVAQIEGYRPIDRKLGLEAYPLSDVADNSVEDIRASHILEHFSFNDTQKVLNEWVRVLQPGGRIRIAVPDFDKITGDLATDPKRFRYLMGGQKDQDDFHRAVFTEATLRDAMAKAGLVNIKRWESKNTDCASLPVSLNLEGYKGDAQKHDLKICAVISIPRLGWNAHWGCVYEALAPWKIPVKRFSGAYWEQGMNELLELCQTPDVVLTLDYDTTFTPKHFDTMLHTLCQHPEIDALCALQPKRRAETPLCTVKNEAGQVIGGGEIDTSLPFKAATGHFGFTLIRTEALRRVVKPWFLSVPNALGSFCDLKAEDVEGVESQWATIRNHLVPDIPGHLHIDADIWFWKQWAKAGNSLYVAPDVRVGHIEEMIADFSGDMIARRSHAFDWFKESSNEGKA